LGWLVGSLPEPGPAVFGLSDGPNRRDRIRGIANLCFVSKIQTIIGNFRGAVKIGADKAILALEKPRRAAGIRVGRLAKAIV
jgi:hypothetical protein